MEVARRLGAVLITGLMGLAAVPTVGGGGGGAPPPPPPPPPPGGGGPCPGNRLPGPRQTPSS
jgi:hypothetical protein